MQSVNHLRQWLIVKSVGCSSTLPVVAYEALSGASGKSRDCWRGR